MIAKSSKSHHCSGLAAMLLSVFGMSACLIPQDDQIISELPQAANRPLRIIQNDPLQRVTTVKVGAGCTRAVFKVEVDDPNATDRISARWFIDPNVRYVAEPGKPVVDGNPGVLSSAGSTVRTVQSNAQFLAQLASFRGQHRVEVLVSDGDFIEGERPLGTSGTEPTLEVVRPTFRSPTGDVIVVPAFTDNFVWFVEIDNAPCG